MYFSTNFFSEKFENLFKHGSFLEKLYIFFQKYNFLVKIRKFVKH